jgi:peptide/nickel transport system substrate-binding protein
MVFLNRALSFILAAFLWVSCNSNKQSDKVYKDQVIVHSLSDPQGLVSITSSDAQASQINANIFQSLLGYNNKDLSLTPVLATALPEVEYLEKGMKITYNIKPEAVFNDGSPVLASDVLFSMKAIFCPGVNSKHIQPGVDFVEDVVLYEEDPRKLTFVCDRVYMLGVHSTGGIPVLSGKLFDSEGLLKNYTFKQLRKDESISQKDDIKKFATFMNSEESSRSPKYITGSGAYYLESWTTDQRVILQKKQDWWGHAFEKESQHFEAYPQKLIYEVINDFNTALTALKDERLDAIFVTPIKEFMDLDKSAKFTENFVKSEPPMLSYTYIGLNNLDPLLKDRRVREALAYLVDVEEINNTLAYGQQPRIVGDIHPSLKNDYNFDIKLRNYDMQKAISLLEEAGWKDTDGDGIRDKVIDGRKRSLSLTYNYNSGNPFRENVGLMIQNWWGQAGIKVEVVPLDWTLYLEQLRSNKVQVSYNGWVTSPRPNDPKQIWHTTSRNGGSNYTGFGNAQSDKLIESIQAEMDPEKRSVLYKQWQQLLHDEVPVIFLFSQNFRNAIHKRFDNVGASPMYPGYWEAGFKIKEGYKVEK